MSRSPKTGGPAWHTLTVEDSFKRLETSPDGLSSDEVAKRLEEYGPNELQARTHVSPWTILLEQFKNVLIIILLLATALSAFLGHGVEAIAITVIVLFAVILGFIQEFRAERAIEALREMAAPSATAIRDGQDQRVPARDLVPGDVIILSTGDKVPADARLIEAVNLQTVEAPLTGESAPVESTRVRFRKRHCRPAIEKTWRLPGLR
ncbi:MAG TPA: HAD-IC family P-type ATPase [Pyrinomonadaceae bacterium]|nr:HAD-IC family P-type ATPase [Pyrinomonadaceae bacterium]